MTDVLNPNQDPLASQNSALIFGDMSLFDEKPVASGSEARVRNRAGELSIKFFSNNAIGLYKGIRPTVDSKGKTTKRGQLGLTKMDDVLADVVQAARNDDPYAYQLLYNLHLASNKFDALMSQCRNVLKEAMHKKLTDGVAAKLSKDENAPVFNVYLKTDFGRHILWKLKELDQFVLENLFCRQHAIIARDASIRLNGGLAHELRNMYHSVFLWKHTGVTRKDVKEDNQVAQRAAELQPHLALDQGIIDGTLTTMFAPRIAERPEDQEDGLAQPTE
ncbi:AcaB family transcriptional regulator [Photobacterium leiognathi]|uniref:AcaB family transcriptional regulator n=1 Tax=Photobacterium leiognathi TaxID=553611 RepID=UPI0029815CD8|nr:AcaB family transcriptional regulator [Photobacterium leiognathi]